MKENFHEGSSTDCNILERKYPCLMSLQHPGLDYYNIEG